MLHPFSRTELLIGKEGLQRLAMAKVAVFGLGGVGSFAVEALARSGVGNLVLIDHDVITITNINRQLLATLNTVGRLKVEVMAERIKSINPSAKLEIHPVFYQPDSEEKLLQDDFTYIIDAIDTMTAKVDLIVKAKRKGLRIISSMGTGNKLDPEKLQVADISQTYTCPLARLLRKELRKRGITNGVKVVFSPEHPVVLPSCAGQQEHVPGDRQIPGSIAFVPPVAGFLLAGAVVRELIGLED
ncbi:MAG: tRNA threonylcarbamoyladenosine dehydratase [bacterium]|jgi:tRNA A37 threonylcarbamoyladenosine dehydratase